MTPQSLISIEARPMRFLEDSLKSIGRSERRHWAQVYVNGVLPDVDRKSIMPMAARIPGTDLQALRQFMR
jgi:hypothetical protein